MRYIILEFCRIYVLILVHILKYKFKDDITPNAVVIHDIIQKQDYIITAITMSSLVNVTTKPTPAKSVLTILIVLPEIKLRISNDVFSAKDSKIILLKIWMLTGYESRFRIACF